MINLFHSCLYLSANILFVLNSYVVLGCIAYNLGTGSGTSVLEMVAAFEKASGKVNAICQFPFDILSRSRSHIC